MQMSRHTPAPSLFVHHVKRGLNVTLLCALGSCALPVFASAQQTKSIPVLSTLPILGKLFVYQQALPADPPARSLFVNVEAKGVTLGALVDLLMDQAHVSYTLDSSLASLPTGNVKLRKVPFSIALETILKMSHGKATYRLENGIYQIIEREAAEAGSTEAIVPNPTKPAGKEDGNASTITPGDGARTKEGDIAETLLTLDAANSNLYSVLKQIFGQVKANWTLDPSLRDVPLTAHLNSIPFRVALDMLLKGLAKPATYRVENGVYKIILKAEETPDSTVPPDMAAAAATAINLDAENIDLYSMLKLMFAQVKANYTLDPNLRNTFVTAHFRGAPFQDALERLLKSTGKPLTYRVKDGIWSIVPKMQ